MNDRAFETLRRDYLAEGPSTMAERVLDAALVEIHGRPRRRGVIASRVPALASRAGGIVSAAAIVTVLVAIGFANLGPAIVAPGSVLPASARIAGIWTTSAETILTWRPDDVTGIPPNLLAVAYAALDGDTWTNDPAAVTIARPAGAEVLAATAEAADPTGRRTVGYTITPERASGLVVAPWKPIRIDTPTRVELDGADGWFVGITRDPSTDPYVVSAASWPPGDPDGPTEARLRAAGAEYPAGMLERYGRAAVMPGTITTPEARELLDEIAAAGSGNPYDLARAAVRILRDPDRFTYDTDVLDLPCSDRSVVDCLAVHRRGYCAYFASTMTVLLRELGVPARYVEGFLPGTEDPITRTWTVRATDAYTWVQVYFPGYGWIDFDPTPGGIASVAPLQTGEP